MVYMKDQVANSKCGIDMKVKWMWRWIDYLWEWILKDGHISLRRSKAIFDQGGSNSVE